MRSILLIIALLLSGCSAEGPEAQLKDYAKRVSNAIDYDFDVQFNHTLPAYPPKRLQQLTVTEQREGLIDVLDLRPCGLLELIGERNSSLGVMAPSSQRLIYELSFLPRLRHCIHELDRTEANDDTENLLQRLRQIEETKHRNLPSVISNAIFSADEISAQFALNAAPLTTETLAQSSNLLPAFERFTHLANISQQAQWPEPPWTHDLETSYASFYQSDFGAGWLKSLSLLTQTLDQTANAIHARLDQRPICFNRTPTPQAAIIRTVFQRYYAQELQPWMSAVHRNGTQWRQQWLTLLEQLPTTPAVEQYFMALFGPQNGSLWQAYTEARTRHTDAWQRLLGDCGMMPGN
ncbi:Protein of unknown function (DUF3080) [Marinobacterium halophilum]|uniref:DUF3080 family protein n=1 Tax=Marinobacterium halophilum TaxID=267374 RepID=A0A2P8EZG4_9GAMM|nr:DUF3080 family protein [Marinobacterium halophilum]PSL14861.1 Protein of unknown function (DUF3080) [Marinobacterium halophilum]